MKNQLRIIGGKFRGRKIQFADLPGLRPTPDRVRETLFNWLAPIIVDAYCLDCFAGSGALGIEALSRGAAHVTFIDKMPQVVQQIKHVLAVLQIHDSNVELSEIPAILTPPAKPFNIIFIDPPFQKNLVQKCSFWLEQQSFLAHNTVIYLEAEASLDPLPIPENWQIIKHKKAGQVGYWLIRRTN